MRLHNLAIVALIAMTVPAAAQTAGGTSGPAGSSIGATPGPSPSGSAVGTPPASLTTPPIDTGTTGSIAPPVAGVPNTSTPGMIGTGASPSGLPGDNPRHPGFPGGVGNTRR